jgi:hypothetical protein
MMMIMLILNGMQIDYYYEVVLNVYYVDTLYIDVLRVVEERQTHPHNTVVCNKTSDTLICMYNLIRSTE